MTKYRWFSVLLFTVILLAGAITVILNSNKKPSVIFFEVTAKDFTANIIAKGDLRAAKAHTVTCPLSGWQTLVYLCPEGSVVEKGDTVAKFDDEALLHELQKAKLQLEIRQAEHQEAIAKLNAEREKLLLEIKRLNTDVAIADLQIRELKSHPNKNELSIAQMEFHHSRAVKDLAQKEYKRVTQEMDKNLQVAKEIRDLEKELNKANADYLRRELELKILQLGPSSLSLEKIAIEKHKKNLDLKQIKGSMPDKIKQLQSTVEQAATKVESSKNRVEKISEKLNRSVVKAPAKGFVLYRVVWGRKVKEGQEYWGGMPLVDIPEMGLTELHGKILERDIQQLEVGQKATISVDGIPDKIFTGEVKKIGKIAVDKSEKEIVSFFGKKEVSGIKIFEIYLTLNQSSPLLLPKMNAQAKIHSQRIARAIVIPNLAIFKEQQQHFVYLYTPGKTVKTTVQPGLTNGQETVIKKGLKIGDKVVLNQKN